MEAFTSTVHLPCSPEEAIGGSDEAPLPAGTTSLKTSSGARKLRHPAVLRTLHLQHQRRATGQPVPPPPPEQHQRMPAEMEV